MTLKEYVDNLNRLVEYGLGDKELIPIKFVNPQPVDYGVLAYSDSIFAYDTASDTVSLFVVDQNMDSIQETANFINIQEEKIVNTFNGDKTLTMAMILEGSKIERERKAANVTPQEEF